MTRQNDKSPIAVIGMSLRTAGAETPEVFWENIVNGVDSFTRPTETQLRRLGVPERLIQDTNFIRSRAVLKNPGAFDAEFFGMSSFTARTTDPAQRLFLTCAWEAMERAGIVPGPEAGIVGVYGGSGGVQESYLVRNFGGGHVDLDDPLVWLPINLGDDPQHITGRVCFYLNLKGPNITALGACATSLLAIHNAVRAIRYGDCDIALAGGFTVATPHWPGYLQVDGGPVSSSGTIRPFSADADGTIFSSGGGVVILKRLEDAESAGDTIHAVIRGTAIFNDGGGKTSLAAPGWDGQTEAISRALEDSGVHPESIGFLEAHGTGTLLGDPMEVEAATYVYRKYTDKKQYCALGAVKANVGHTAAGAGVLAFIKTCMALEHCTIPPNINVASPHPDLNLPATPFYLPTESSAWGSNDTRCAAVSAFGFGGINAHIVLEEAKPPLKLPSTSGQEIIVLSARTSKGVKQQIQQLTEHIRKNLELRLGDIAHTLQTGRKAFNHRAAWVVDDLEELAGATNDGPIHISEATDEAAVIFAFSGQGSQRAGMGSDLYHEDPIYRADIDRCAEVLVPFLEMDLRDILCSSDDEAEKIIKQTAYSQPALFVVEYALAKRLMRCGIQPVSMIGHSLGELVAACLAGVFTLPDALALVALRGKLMQACQPGSMMAIFLAVKEVEPFLDQGIEIAAFNAPDSTVVSGSDEAIVALSKGLEVGGVGFRILETSHAFHSASMEPTIDPFREALSKVELSSPSIPFISNVSGRFITDEEAKDPNYWAKHIRCPVRFTQGVDTLKEQKGAVWVEVGPGSALTSLLKRQTTGSLPITTLDGDQQHSGGLNNIIARLWVAGVEVDWQEASKQKYRQKVPLPTYPFEYENHWIEPPVFSQSEEGDRSAETTILGKEEYLHVTDWQEVALRNVEIFSSEGWLIFEDREGLGESIRKKVSEAKVSVVCLVRGDQFEKLHENYYQIRPDSSDDIQKVLLEKKAAGWFPKKILHLWNFGNNARENVDEYTRWEACIHNGFSTLGALFRALNEEFPEEEIEVTVAMDGISKLEHEDGPIYWEKASLQGLCRVAPQEFPALSFQLIDIPFGNSSSKWLTDALIAEVIESEPAPLKLLREGHRYIEVFRRLPESSSKGMRSGGVALITGGMGGLGLEIAGRLFDMAGMRLALLTRWEPPAVEDWPERSETDDRIGRALKKVVALQERGVEVLVVKGDSQVFEDMARVVKEVRSHFGSIDGVIHAAGVSSPSLILEADLETSRKIFSPKVKGALILERLLGNDPLDFFVHFSSISSVAPTPGQADYSGANAVLDALAKRQGHSNWKRVCAMSWDAWEDVGMAAEGAREKSSGEMFDPVVVGLSEKEIFERRYKSSITLQQGLDYFQELLFRSSLPSHVIVSSRINEIATAREDAQTVKEDNINENYKAPSSDLEKIVVEIWQKVFLVDGIGVNDDFFVLGGDSISSIQILNRIRQRLGVKLTNNAIFNLVTPAELSVYIEEQL